MEHNAIFDIIKKEFCSLFAFKSHGETLEVITPLATLTDKFISVFITHRGNDIIITDGGWITDNIYDCSFVEDEKDILDNLSKQFLSYFNILTTTVSGRGLFYYKKTNKIEMIPACVFDMANFILSVVNANSLEYKSQTDKLERDKFRKETNDYLKSIYNGQFTSNKEISRGLKFNGVIRKRQKLHLLEYVTGSTPRYIDQEIRRAMVNFQIVNDLPIISQVESRIAIFNDKSVGFQKGLPPILVEYLHKYTSREYITRSSIDIIREIIPTNGSN